ncbi:MAG: hypothetical protein COT74_04545 [Bdellovibrionales bacterium CG10_big_fil_rev_8_21_14_0_10_45_34]|nr:MAG: hypothetical protein COT74_04545 [Bdellovibrionales bacterium CG10_big_fil_rev_8_21_14_0_10_45_34]
MNKSLIILIGLIQMGFSTAGAEVDTAQNVQKMIESLDDKELEKVTRSNDEFSKWWSSLSEWQRRALRATLSTISPVTGGVLAGSDLLNIIERNSNARKDEESRRVMKFFVSERNPKIPRPAKSGSYDADSGLSPETIAEFEAAGKKLQSKEGTREKWQAILKRVQCSTEDDAHILNTKDTGCSEAAIGDASANHQTKITAAPRVKASAETNAAQVSAGTK